MPESTIFKGIVAEKRNNAITEVSFPDKTIFRGFVVEDLNRWKDIRYPQKTVFKGFVIQFGDIMFPQIIRRE